MSARIHGLNKKFVAAKRAVTRAESAFKSGRNGPDHMALLLELRAAESRANNAWDRFFEAVDQDPGWTWSKTGKAIPVSGKK